MKEDFSMHYVPDVPDDEEEQPIYFCDECNGDIYEGDSIFKIDGDKICEDCLDSYFGYCKYTATKGD